MSRNAVEMKENAISAVCRRRKFPRSSTEGGRSLVDPLLSGALIPYYFDRTFEDHHDVIFGGHFALAVSCLPKL
jgi:hypothetical protein